MKSFSVGNRRVKTQFKGSPIVVAVTGEMGRVRVEKGSAGQGVFRVHPDKASSVS